MKLEVNAMIRSYVYENDSFFIKILTNELDETKAIKKFTISYYNTLISIYSKTSQYENIEQLIYSEFTRKGGK